MHSFIQSGLFFFYSFQKIYSEEEKKGTIHLFLLLPLVLFYKETSIEKEPLRLFESRSSRYEINLLTSVSFFSFSMLDTIRQHQTI